MGSGKSLQGGKTDDGRLKPPLPPSQHAEKSLSRLRVGAFPARLKATQSWGSWEKMRRMTSGEEAAVKGERSTRLHLSWRGDHVARRCVSSNQTE